MLEKFIERKLVKEVEARGGLCMKFISPGLVGVPDRIIVTNRGRVIFVEIKTDKGHVSDMQGYMLQMLRSRGVEVRVVRGMDGVKELIRELDDDNTRHDNFIQLSDNALANGEIRNHIAAERLHQNPPAQEMDDDKSRKELNNFRIWHMQR